MADKNWKWKQTLNYELLNIDDFTAEVPNKDSIQNHKQVRQTPIQPEHDNYKESVTRFGLWSQKRKSNF